MNHKHANTHIEKVLATINAREIEVTQQCEGKTIKEISDLWEDFKKWRRSCLLKELCREYQRELRCLKNQLILKSKLEELERNDIPF